MSRTPSPSLSTSREQIAEASTTSPAGEHRRSSIFSRFLFRSTEKRDSDESVRTSSPVSGERSASPSQPKSPTRSRSKKFANFASRSIRKSQWRLFKHRTFFGSQRSSIKKNQLQLPRLTLRHPSVDGSAMPFPLDGNDDDDDDAVSASTMTATTTSTMMTAAVATSSTTSATTMGRGDEPSFLAIRTQHRRWTESESGRLRDSRDSSGFHDSHDAFDAVDDPPQAMTAPVSPSVPLSASSSQSDGWKYSSQKLLWKLKPRYINFSHASSTSSSTDSAWKSLDSTTWRSVDGAEVVLRGARLEALSEIERSALQVLAAQRLARLLPGISLGKPKDPLAALRQKRQKLVKSNRTLTVTDANRRPSGSGASDAKRVFGVSLADCMQNEKRLDQESRCRSLDDSSVGLVPHSRGAKQAAKSVKSEPEMMHPLSASSSVVATMAGDDRKWLYPSTQNLYPSCSSHPTSPSPLVGSAPPTCSLLPNVASTSASQLSAVDHEKTITGRFTKKQRPSSASFSCSLDASTDDVDPHALQVPRIVENCTQYLMAYGLNSVGLFRVAGNTKRCRQLRNALEKGGGGTAISDEIVENTTAHDVATLLKEYFRDLPQSLLPKEHYQAYIACSKDRIEAIRLLVALLFSPNIDTLFVLLKFLHEVALHCNDQTAADGTALQGNKMDARNLATIFAPSILRADHEKLHATLAENEQQIAVVETMVTSVEEIFMIPKELQCKMYNKLRETEPDRLDRILNLLSRADGNEHPLLYSPFPATLEEDSPRDKSLQASPMMGDHSHIGRQSPLARELHHNGKIKVTSQRSGSWPFSLTRPGGTPNATGNNGSNNNNNNCSPKLAQRFFPASQDDDAGSQKSATATPAVERRHNEPTSSHSDVTDTNSAPIDMEPTTSLRRRAETSASSLAPKVAESGGVRSTSRERVDTIRTAARTSAAAARRRLRNVVRAFRFSSMTRSSPDIVQSQAL